MMKPHLLLKSFQIRTFIQSCIFSFLFFAVLAGFYWQSQDANTPLDIQIYILMFAFIFLFGILQWMFQKNTLWKLLNAPTEPQKKNKPSSANKQDSEEHQTIQRNREKRLFVHLFTVLQRQGRLMDFLKEDLSHYQDAQIGAAVRNIHENCRKTVDRYLAPEPVMKEDEGDLVKIPEGFDPNAIKLVGNVVGTPPFSGILRHRGWQVQTIRMPELSETENPNIIAPAEVEVQ